MAASIARIGDIFGLNLPNALNHTKKLMQGPFGDTQEVLNTVQNFTMWAMKYSVDLSCFYETEKTVYEGPTGECWNDFVVSEQSACLPGWPKHSIAANHARLNKFDGMHNPAYQELKNVIVRMAISAPEKIGMRFNPQLFLQDNSLVPAASLECMKALVISWPEAELKGMQRRMGHRTPETCWWLVTNPDYGTWIGGQRPQILRLEGMPGMGKTVMILFLIEQLTERLRVTANMTLAYHFCDSRNPSSVTANAIMRNLLFQIFQQRPTLIHLLQEIWSYQGDNLFQSFDDLWLIFVQALKVYGEGELFILIDGLDACDEQSRQIFVEGLAEIASSTLGVRILFTCRGDVDVKLKYSWQARIRSCSFSKDDINRDLHRWLKEHVPEVCRNSMWGKREDDLITNSLLEKADGSFLWCTFMLDHISKVSSKAQVGAALKSLPEGLNEAYRGLTAAIADMEKDTAKIILEIVAAARRPLKGTELTLAYILAEESPHRWLDSQCPLEDDIDHYDDMYKCCGRLLKYDSSTDTVQLAHESVRDFLKHEFLVQDGESQTELCARLNTLFLEICFRLFSMSDFDHLASKMMMGNEQALELGSEVPDGHQYIVEKWQEHAALAETNPTEGMDRMAKYLSMRTPLLNSWTQSVFDRGNDRFGNWLKSKGGKGHPVRYISRGERSDSDGWETDDADSEISESETSDTEYFDCAE